MQQAAEALSPDQPTHREHTSRGWRLQPVGTSEFGQQSFHRPGRCFSLLLVAARCCLLRLAASRSLLDAACCLLFAARCCLLLFAARCCSLIAACCSLLAAHCSLLAASACSYLLLTACCLRSFQPPSLDFRSRSTSGNAIGCSRLTFRKTS